MEYREARGPFKIAKLFIYAMSKLTEYIKDTQAELKHVSWPTRQQAIAFTVVVILISIVVSFFLGLFDSLFQLGLSKIV